MHLTYRQSCRICGSTALTKVISLGEQHLQGAFVKPGKQLPPLRKIPINLLRCDPTKDENACGLLQVEHSTPAEILYSTYWYRSGTNSTMRNHLKDVAEYAMTFVDGENKRLLDIGCNDGTLLNNYPKDYEVIGIDPSDIVLSIDPSIKAIRDFFPSKKLTKLAAEKPFKVITSIAMFYDLEDPMEFVTEIKKILDKDGVWIFEISYMPKMLELNSYDTICHEHLEYYSLSVIENLLTKAGMKLIDASLNDTNGGSICCSATHIESSKLPSNEAHLRIQDLRYQEFNLALDTDAPYKNFQDRIDKHKDQLNELLRKLIKEGKTIHIYGASTKGNTILQWCGIDSRIISYAAERNPEKFGARTLGTDIPIISEQESRAMNPDYYLVLPWHFKTEFLEREKDLLSSGTKMIFPLPEVQIIG